MTTTIKLMGGTAAAWTAENPILSAREPGLETDTGKWKWGDGVTAWNALPYVPDLTGAGGSATGAYVGSTGAQSVPNGGAIINLTTTHTAHADFTVSLAGDSVTVVNAGWYGLEGAVYLSAAHAAEFYASIISAGVTLVTANGSLGNRINTQCSGFHYLAAGAVVQLRLNNWTGSARTTLTDAGAVNTYLRLVRL